MECVLNVPNSNAFLLDQHPHHIEPVGLVRAAMPIDPDQSRPRKLTLLSPAHRLDGLTELRPAARLDLDEAHEPVALHHQIDVAVTAPKPSHQNAPSLLLQPALGHPLAQLPERQSVGRHGATKYGD